MKVKLKTSVTHNLSSYPSFEKGDEFLVLKKGNTNHGEYFVIENLGARFAISSDLISNHLAEPSNAQEQANMTFYHHPCQDCGVFWENHHYIQKKSSASKAKKCFTCRTSNWSYERILERRMSAGEEQIKASLRLSKADWIALKVLAETKRITRSEVAAVCIQMMLEQEMQKDPKIRTFYDTFLLIGSEK